MPKEFDDIVNALKKDHSDASAYAIATAQWKKNHGGKLPSGKYPKEKDESMERLERAIVEGQKVLRLDESARGEITLYNKYAPIFRKVLKDNLDSSLFYSRASEDYPKTKTTFYIIDQTQKVIDAIKKQAVAAGVDLISARY